MTNKKKFWICGKHAVFEAIKNKKREVTKVIVNDELKKNEIKKFNQNIKYLEVRNNKHIAKLIKNNSINHQGYIAEIQNENRSNNEYKKLFKNFKTVIILDGVTDPRNIGSIIRTSSAFNVDAVIVNEREFKSDSIAMYKAASGAMEKISIIKYSNIKYAVDDLVNENFNIISFSSDATHSIKKENFQEKNAFIFGSEEKGISEKILKKSQKILKIDIQNIESLNVSNTVSAVLAIHQFSKSLGK